MYNSIKNLFVSLNFLLTAVTNLILDCRKLLQKTQIIVSKLMCRKADKKPSFTT